MTTDKKSVDLNDLLTLDQLSQLLQVKKSWIYRQVRELSAWERGFAQDV